MGIICFPSLQRLAEDVSNQFAQEIQKALVGKPAGKRRAVWRTSRRAKQLCGPLPGLWLSPSLLSRGVKVQPLKMHSRPGSDTEDLGEQRKRLEEGREGGLGKICCSWKNTQTHTLTSLTLPYICVCDIYTHIHTQMPLLSPCLHQQRHTHKTKAKQISCYRSWLTSFSSWSWTPRAWAMRLKAEGDSRGKQ